MDIHQNLFKFGTQLEDRFLTYDGDVILEENDIIQARLDGTSMDNIYVDVITPEIKKYNTTKSTKIQIKDHKNKLDTTWNIPSQYEDIDIENYVYTKFETLFNNDEYYTERLDRIKFEFDEYKKFNLYMFLKTLVYMTTVMEQNNVVWGVGRGSSVSSFILYIIGIHDIDSYKYELNFKEFLR